MSKRNRQAPRRNRRRNERGSVLIEMAFVVPILMTLVLGMIEMGMAWRDQQTITQATRQGARVGSHLGTEANADQQGAAAVMAVLDDDQRSNVNFIMIYEPINAAGDPSTACQTLADSGDTGTGGHADECNYWGEAVLRSPTFDATTLTASNWLSTGRKDSLSGTGPDRYGVMVEVYRPWFTGYFPGSGTDIRARTIMQLEPDIS